MSDIVLMVLGGILCEKPILTNRIKENVSVVLMDPIHAKMAMSDSQHFP